MSDINPLLKVYLGGPITGASDDEMRPWREIARQHLKLTSEFLDPTQRTMHTTDNLTVEERMKIGVTVVADDFQDVNDCDVALFNLTGASRVSIGSVIEMAWAGALGKKIVIVKDDYNVHDDYLLNTDTFVTLRTSDLTEALEYIERLHVIPTFVERLENDPADKRLFASMLEYVARQKLIEVNLNKHTQVNIYHVVQLAIAHVLQVPTIVTMSEGNVHDHAMLRTICSKIVSN